MLKLTVISPWFYKSCQKCSNPFSKITKVVKVLRSVLKLAMVPLNIIKYPSLFLTQVIYSDWFILLVFKKPNQPMANIRIPMHSCIFEIHNPRKFQPRKKKFVQKCFCKLSSKILSFGKWKTPDFRKILAGKLNFCGFQDTLTIISIENRDKNFSYMRKQ